MGRIVELKNYVRRIELAWSLYSQITDKMCIIAYKEVEDDEPIMYEKSKSSLWKEVNQIWNPLNWWDKKTKKNCLHTE
jgi:hypothetical protein